MDHFLTPEEIAGHRPEPVPQDGLTPLDRAKMRMNAAGQWHAAQAMGRRWAIGCVALEITQRCNLDCSLCYLSENSEAVKDIPIEEVFRRIDTIFEMYGPNTDVQVTGGDPTLRKRNELIAIVRRIRDKGMRPTLFTNGIKATRDLLEELAEAGLIDVAFHVDMTQERRGYGSEVELNKIRQEYIERARGLGLAVIFNTTVYRGNFDDIPEMVAFFVRNSDIVTLASFQLQADTGRGVLRERDVAITPDSLADRIRTGARADLAFDTLVGGHRRCNRYAAALVCNGRVYGLLDDVSFMRDMLEKTAGIVLHRNDRRRAVAGLARWLCRHPRDFRRVAKWAAPRLWAMRRDLVASRAKVNKISFFIHNFMDACRLEKERIDSCIFMAATAQGPVSMCLHNARRDDFILQKLTVKTAGGKRLWDPLTGEFEDGDPSVRHRNGRIPLKGRAKEAAREKPDPAMSG